MIDSFFPVLANFDDRIDEIEDAILKDPTEEQLGELFDMKRTLVSMRKWSPRSETCSPACSAAL